jgi:ABC-type bacteriocin/lantibiotic exporter with double-glycine peptidase domain
MKITNILLIILICLIAWQKFPSREEKIVSSSTDNQGIVIGQTVRQTKEIKAVSLEKERVIKHASTIRNYFDTDGRRTTSLNHNIRIGKDYYISGGIYSRENNYQNSYGGDISITKYW